MQGGPGLYRYPFIYMPTAPSSKTLEPLIVRPWLPLSLEQTQVTQEIRPTHSLGARPWAVVGIWMPEATDGYWQLYFSRLLERCCFRSTWLPFFLLSLILVSEPSIEDAVFGHESHRVLILGPCTKFLSSPKAPFHPLQRYVVISVLGSLSED